MPHRKTGHASRCPEIGGRQEYSEEKFRWLCGGWGNEPGRKSTEKSTLLLKT
jgi:hypothetical protein